MCRKRGDGGNDQANRRVEDCDRPGPSKGYVDLNAWEVGWSKSSKINVAGDER